MSVVYGCGPLNRNGLFLKDDEYERACERALAMAKSHRLATNTAADIIDEPNYDTIFPSPDAEEGTDNDNDDEMTPISPSGVASFPESPTPAPKSNLKKGHGTPASAKKHKAKKKKKKKKKKNPMIGLSDEAHIASNDAKAVCLP